MRVRACVCVCVCVCVWWGGVNVCWLVDGGRERNRKELFWPVNALHMLASPGHDLSPIDRYIYSAWSVAVAVCSKTPSPSPAYTAASDLDISQSFRCPQGARVKEAG